MPRRRTSGLDGEELRHLLTWQQDGVVARRQILELGGDDNDIERMLRKHELVPVLPGVYIDHSGRPTRTQQEWVAVLFYWPAVLADESALPELDSPVVHVAVDRDRHVGNRKGIAVRRISGLAKQAEWDRRPPRLTYEDALLNVMIRRVRADDVAGAFAALAKVCFRGYTNAHHLEAALDARPRVPQRKLLQGLLDDWRTGACSVLERGYLHHVERPHGLPTARRQRRSRATGRATDQDAWYEAYGLVVELDGRAFHDSPEARDADALRDLAELATSGDVTVRLTYGLVYGDPCRTARWVATLLRQRGWTGTFRRCPRCPPV